MKVVILAGGRGTRISEETEVLPKPMVEIGGKPILWHIMRIYSHFGYRRFVLCLGYKGEMFRDYFLRYHHYSQDLIVRTGRETRVEHLAPCEEEWEIVLAETGVKTTTGGRLRAIERYIDTPRFMMTYGDGVADVDDCGIDPLPCVSRVLKNSRLPLINEYLTLSPLHLIHASFRPLLGLKHENGGTLPASAVFWIACRTDASPRPVHGAGVQR